MVDPQLFIVSGPSGAGKTTLCSHLLETFSDLDLSISYTTRSARPGESSGRDYHFVTLDAFEAMIDQGSFAEWARVHGHYYGTSIDQVERSLSAGRSVLFDIDYQGARQLKQRWHGAVAVFILPPSLEALEQRLRGRATDSDEVIQVRMRNAIEEIAQYELFDYILLNLELDRTVTEIECVYRTARYQTGRMSSHIQQFLASRETG